MLANRALVKLHRLIPRAVDLTDYGNIDKLQPNHRPGEERLVTQTEYDAAQGKP